jgi:hypothetical protein
MSRIDEAIAILEALGLPRAQRNERSALTLLALMDLRRDTPWSKSKQRPIGIHNIIAFIREYYGKTYAENARETIRRQTIHQFEQAAIAIRNPDDPARPRNSPKTVYAITDEALEAIRQYSTPDWQTASYVFVRDKGKLIDRYERRKKQYLIPVDLPNGTLISFSPGKHNELQKKVIEEFRLRFCPNSEVVYVSDVARKSLYVDEDLLGRLKIPITEHGKLPDVVFYDRQTDHLFLIEAVTTHGPLSPKRQIELQEMLKCCKAKQVYISAFPGFREFKKHVNDIAWETEVWIQSNADHLIHFNGPKFFAIHN